MYLLDTNHCSKLWGRDPSVLSRIASRTEAPVTCVVVHGELMFMAYNSDQRTANLRMIGDFLDTSRVLELDRQAASIYGEVKAALLQKVGAKERSKRRNFKFENLGMSDNDLWIAAIAKRHDMTVVSRDGDFDRIKVVTELRVESWFDH